MPIGTKLAVWRGQAHKTSGGLTKNQLMVNKRGKVVSIKQHHAGKKAFARNGLRPKSKDQMRAMRGKGGQVGEGWKLDLLKSAGKAVGKAGLRAAAKKYG